MLSRNLNDRAAIATCFLHSPGCYFFNKKIVQSFANWRRMAATIPEGGERDGTRRPQTSVVLETSLEREVAVHESHSVLL